jgi:hypothetical protein
MGAIKFPHSSGNSMSIAAPATNPASDLELKLPATIGTANQYLKNSGTAGTLEFATLSVTDPKILNRVYASTTTEVSVTSVTATDIGLSVNITPSATNSVIHIYCNTYLLIHKDWSNIGAGVYFHRTISGSGSIIYTPKNASSTTSGGANEFGIAHSNNQAGGNQSDDLQGRVRLITEFYDTTHNTTSEITYKAQGACGTDDRNSLADFHDQGAYGVLTVTEIAA